MFERTNFVIKQLQRAKAAMEQPALAGFTPDGRSVVDVAAMLYALETAKTEAITRVVAVNDARGTVDIAWVELHAMCVSAAAAMRSVYRNDASALTAIRAIPTKDETPRRTLGRAGITASAWAVLPDMPNTNPPEPFRIGALSLGTFSAKLAELREKISACEGCESELKLAQGALKGLVRADGEFISALVSQGRALFPEGSPGRPWIDTVPLVPGTRAPLPAEILAATSPVPGAVHLEFEAKHATSFTIQHRAPGGVEFVLVAEDVAPPSFDLTDMPPGQNAFIVTGVNSRGEGEPSPIAVVEVLLAAVA